MKKAIALLTGAVMLFQMSIGSTAAFDAPKLNEE